MRSKSILSSQLEYFLMVYIKKSYTLAAKSIPMSTQGLTKSIHILEKELDVLLFESSGSAMLKPTVFADKLYEMLQEWSKDTKELEEAYRQMKCSSVKTLRLGAAVGTLGAIGIDFGERFSRKNPSLRIQCVEAPDALTDGHLATGEYNIALTVAPYNEAFSTIEILTGTIYAWVPKNNPLSSREVLSIEDFKDQKVAIVDSSFKVYEQFTYEFDERGVEPALIATTAEIFWIYMFAKSQKGIGIGVDHLNTVFSMDDSVSCIPVEGQSWSFGLSTRKGYEPSDDEKTLIEYILTKKRSALR